MKQCWKAFPKGNWANFKFADKSKRNRITRG